MSEWSVERAAPAALEELLAYPLKPEDREYVSQGARQLIEALLVEPGLTERGFHKSLDFLRRGLRTLSEITADSESDPGVADEKIERPLYMVGLPRSGTTFFHTLLSCDPAARSPRMWELEFPSPPPAAETFYDDPRIDQWIELQKGPNARSAVAISDPNVRKIHLAGPTATDECGPMLNSSGRALPMIAAARLSPPAPPAPQFGPVLGTQEPDVDVHGRRGRRRLSRSLPRPDAPRSVRSNLVDIELHRDDEARQLRH
jgi:hypothetical protein